MFRFCVVLRSSDTPNRHRLIKLNLWIGLRAIKRDDHLVFAICKAYNTVKRRANCADFCKIMAVYATAIDSKQFKQ